MESYAKVQWSEIRAKRHVEQLLVEGHVERWRGQYGEGEGEVEGDSKGDGDRIKMEKERCSTRCKISLRNTLRLGNWCRCGAEQEETAL